MAEISLSVRGLSVFLMFPVVGQSGVLTIAPIAADCLCSALGK
jgi:hypothetical protein